MSDTAASTHPAPALPHSPASIAVRTALLALGLLVAMVAGNVLAGALLPSVGEALAAELPEGAAGAGALTLVALLQALVLVPFALHARRGGWRLALGIGGAYWLVVWLLSAIEAAVYLGPILPAGFLTLTGTSQGAIAVAVGALVAVLFRPAAESFARRHPPLLDERVRLRAWGARLVVICLLYLVAYVIAGMFIAWRNPEVRAFYEPIGVPAPEVVLGVQLARGVLWAAAAGLLLWVLDASRRTAAVLVGLAFAILMASTLIPPNPLLPPEVRTTNFIEIASSNLVFGIAAAWILTRRAKGARDPAPTV